MPRHNLPTYAIVELLMRLAQHNKSIGDYKDHSVFDEGVMVKTTCGAVRFPLALIRQQFENPELINDAVLLDVAASFRSSGSR